MAEIGGAILSSVIGAVFQSLASPVVKKLFPEIPDVSKLLETLKVKLGSANSLLNDAEDKQVKNENVKKWVDDLSEVINEADNATDVLRSKALRCEIEGNHWTKKINPLAKFETKMKKRLQDIIDSLERLLGEVGNLGLRAHVGGKRLSRTPAPLIEDPSHVYGRDDNQKAILDLVFAEKNDGQDKIFVIPIVGMGGVGKTTLARLVYNDSRVKNDFEHRAWVTVSDDFSVLNLAKRALEGLTSKRCEVPELEKLGEEMKKFLGGKKFFLVLDDVWNEDYSDWNSLKSFFQVGSDGGKIIVTTRSEKIGSNMESVSKSSYFLRPMEDEECWKLFQKHAFSSAGKHAEQLKTIGKEIVKKCKGLPLAVVSLAGLLRSVSDPNEWKKVEKSDIWEIERKGDDEILPSLWLSYNYLPSNVKRCFAYCSTFPKDYEYESKNMVLLWMAEGLVQAEEMEDVGEEYFKTLVSRCLLQRSATNASSFLMHDLIHDLATFVLGKDTCVTLGEGDDLGRITSKTQHLVSHSYHDHAKGLSRAKSLRTFVTTSYIRELPMKFGCLRVLTIAMDKVPNSIGMLKHLRYLDLSHSNLEMLPNTICKLYNLQTLLLRSCHKLTQLPTKMDKLINLRHLDISETDALKEIPSCIGKMEALRTITKFVAGSEMIISDLKKFPHLRGCLNICGLENIMDANDVWDAEFRNKSLLTQLNLEWRRSVMRDSAVLDAFQPHSNLKKLSITGYGGYEFSRWVTDHSFSNITEVSLKECNYCFELPSFGQLPALKKLQVNELHSVEEIGSEFYGPSAATPFPSLKILKITHMKKLQRLSFKVQGAFQSLEELKLEDCLMLQTISLDPSQCLPSLKKLSIWNCPKLEFSGLPLPSSLKELDIDNCDMVCSQRVHWGLEALTTLTIRGCKNAVSFPEEGLLPSILTNLSISYFLNLESLNGKAFQLLTSLKELEIGGCPNLLSLPEERLPASLEYLRLYDCSELLTSRLYSEEGNDWKKVSHIPKIELPKQRPNELLHYLEELEFLSV